MKRTTSFFLALLMLLILIPFSALAEEQNYFATGYNRGRGENDLIVYTPAFGSSTNTNVYGREAVVDENGKIISNLIKGNSQIPEGGFVISGHGTMSDWVFSNCEVGKYCSFNQNNLEITISDSPIESGITDMFYSIQKVVDGVNSGRGTDQVVVFTNSGNATGTNQWGYEVVVEDGRVVSRGGNDNWIPKNGFVISGHGSGASWIGAYAKIGMKAEFDRKTKTLVLEMDGEAYLSSIDIDIAELGTKYSFVKENFIYCDYEYLDSAVSQIKSLRDGYASLETEKEQCQCIADLSELVKRAITACGESRTVEYRGTWVLPTQTTQAEVSEYVQRLYDAGINLISLETLSDSTLICRVPEGSLFEHNPKLKGFDLLQAYIEECHARGMELHIWMPVFCVTHKNYSNFEKSPWYKKPEWRSINDSGKDSAVKDQNTQCFLNPANPEVQDFLLETYKFILETYDIDGFELDYIRYQAKDGDDYGYDDITINGFKEKYGIVPEYNTGASYWDDWAQYRCDIITDFVGRLSALIDEVAPDVLLSADVGTNAESAPEGIYQDYGAWLENGYIDLLKPMSYSLESISETYINVQAVKGKYLGAGVGSYSDMFDNFAIANHVNIANQQGADGVVFFESATHLGKDCSEYLLETGAFRNKAVTPTYSPATAAESVLDYAIARIDDVIIPLNGISQDICTNLKSDIYSAKALISSNKDEAVDAVNSIISSLGDTNAEKSLKGDLAYCLKILNNMSDSSRVPPEGPSVSYDPKEDETHPVSKEESKEESNAESQITSTQEGISSQGEQDKENSNSYVIWIVAAIVFAVVLAVVVILFRNKKK